MPGCRFFSGLVLSVAVGLAAVPGWAQMPPGPDLSCLCLQQSVDDAHTDLQTKHGAFNAAQAQLGELDNQLAAARAQMDVNNPQSVAAFRQLLARRDAEFRQSNGDLIAATQAATATYNQTVAAYNNQCAGRPLPPPPPGPLNCPGR
jgi:hypothetical protein